MILFDLICSKGHGFEAWFRDSDSFDRLLAVGEIQCTACGDSSVKKALMAPNISTSKAKPPHAVQEATEEAALAGSGSGSGSGTKTSPSTDSKPTSMTIQDSAAPFSEAQKLPVPAKVAEAMQVLRQVQSHIEKTFDHVGERFAEEARKMHYGEAEKRSIYGEATKDEAVELADEGIDVNQMPWLPTRNS